MDQRQGKDSEISSGNVDKQEDKDCVNLLYIAATKGI